VQTQPDERGAAMAAQQPYAGPPASRNQFGVLLLVVPGSCPVSIRCCRRQM
jgi:hypothetical protein